MKLDTDETNARTNDRPITGSSTKRLRRASYSPPHSDPKDNTLSVPSILPPGPQSFLGNIAIMHSKFARSLVRASYIDTDKGEE